MRITLRRAQEELEEFPYLILYFEYSFRHHAVSDFPLNGVVAESNRSLYTRLIGDIKGKSYEEILSIINRGDVFEEMYSRDAISSDVDIAPPNSDIAAILKLPEDKKLHIVASFKDLPTKVVPLLRAIEDDLLKVDNSREAILKDLQLLKSASELLASGRELNFRELALVSTAIETRPSLFAAYNLGVEKDEKQREKAEKMHNAIAAKIDKIDATKATPISLEQLLKKYPKMELTTRL